MATRGPTQRPAPTYSGPQTAFSGDVRPLDRPDLRQRAQQAYRIGDVFHRISDFAQEKATENAVANAQRDAATQGVSSKKITVMRGGKPTEIDIPVLNRREGLGASAKAWNQAAESVYAMRLSTATMQHIQGAALEHQADPEGFKQSLEGWKEGIKDLIPPEHQAQYEHDLYSMSQPLITRAENEMMRNIARDQDIDAGLYQDELVNSMVLNSTLGAEGAAQSAMQFNKFVEETQKRIGPFYSEADARKDIHETLKRTAAGALMTQFQGSGDKRAMMDAFQSGKPVVTMPAVDEEGNVTVGLYDKDSLIQMLGAEKVQNLVSGLETDIRIQDSERKAAAAEAKAAENERLYGLQTDIQVVIEDEMMKAELTGRTDLTGADIAEAFPGEKYRKTREKLMGDLALAAEKGAVTKQIAQNEIKEIKDEKTGEVTGYVNEDLEMLKELEPDPAKPGIADQVKLYNTAVAEYERKQKELSTDPASYVMRTDEDVQAKWAKSAEDPSDPALAQAAVAATKAAQTRYGVAPEKIQAMPPAQAASIASTIMTASPDTIAQEVDRTVQLYGEDGMQQVIAAGVPPAVKMVAFLDAPEYAAERQIAADSIKVKESVLVEQAKARGVSTDDVDTAIEGLAVIGNLQSTLPPSVFKGYLDGIRQSALYQIASNSMSAEDAVAKAAAPFADYYRFNSAGSGGSSTYRVPKHWDAEKISQALSGVIASAETLNIKPSIVGATGDAAFDTAETVAAIKSGHYRWVTNDNDTGVILSHENPGEGPVKRPDGSRITFTFDELMVMPLGPHSRVDRDLNKGGVQN